MGVERMLACRVNCNCPIKGQSLPKRVCHTFAHTLRFRTALLFDLCVWEWLFCWDRHAWVPSQHPGNGQLKAQLKSGQIGMPCWEDQQMEEMERPAAAERTMQSSSSLLVRTLRC